jgi:hypothetical protein
MKPPKNDLTGQKFGRLTVTGKWERRAKSNLYWEAECECGNIKMLRVGNLTSGHIRSCGCLVHEGKPKVEEGADELIEEQVERNICTIVQMAGTIAGEIEEDDSDVDEEDEDCPASSGKAKQLPLGLGDIDRDQLNRYELLYRPRSGYWGFYDRQRDCETLISRSKHEALERIFQLRRHPAEESAFVWAEVVKPAA